MKSLIIPTAGYAKRLAPLNTVPKVLIKLNGVPIFHLLYLKAQELQMDNIILAVSSEFERQLKNFLETNYKNSTIPIYVEVVDDPNAGVLYSVYAATASKKCHEQALIILSDTLYQAELPVHDDRNNAFVVYEEITGDPSRWCLVETDSFGVSKKYWDKPQGECPTRKALIGVYYVKTELFNAATREIVSIGNKVRGEFQLSQALEKYLEIEPIFALHAQPGAWNDTGTLETLREASQNFFISRSFNHIKIQEGKLIKETKSKKALKNQYMWYETCANKSLIPTIYNYSETQEYAKIEMELCSIVDLGSIFNFCDAEPVFFEQVISYLLRRLDKELYRESIEANSLANQQMFVIKLEERLKQSEFPLPEKFDKLVEYLTEIAKKQYFTHIHGDLILSNILFDPQRMMFKLIDPRGEYGDLSINGDLRYDLAKLLHSLDGRYESIINNLYDIIDNTVVYYSNTDKDKCFKAGQEVLFNFAKSKGIDKKELLAIEASLYLSMLPLHDEDKKRQQAFYLIAEQIIKENF